MDALDRLIDALAERAAAEYLTSQHQTEGEDEPARTYRAGLPATEEAA